jgi:putative spermidine/putrescine transport system ATP-binding protein
MKPFVEIQGLSKYYGLRKVVNDVNISINEGEIFTFLGPSGAGKSTILHCIIGMINSEEGRILLNGKDITRIPSNKRNVGLVFQNYSLFPSMTVAQNVAFPLIAQERKTLGDFIKAAFASKKKADIERKVNEILAFVKLETHADKKTGQLSGGEQQRVALARALVFEPELLCLDEPLGALDKNLRFEMQYEIRLLQQRFGKTMLYVTHDQAEAFTISDRIAIINNGIIEQIGAPEQLYKHPVNDFVALFLGECNIFEIKEVKKIVTGYSVSTKGGSTFICRKKPEIGTDVIGIRPENLKIHGTRNAHQKIEAQIISMTFLGGRKRLVAQSSPSEKLIVTVNSDNSIKPGSKITFEYDINSIFVLPKTAAGEIEKPGHINEVS